MGLYQKYWMICIPTRRARETGRYRQSTDGAQRPLPVIAPSAHKTNGLQATGSRTGARERLLYIRGGEGSIINWTVPYYS